MRLTLSGWFRKCCNKPGSFLLLATLAFAACKTNLYELPTYSENQQLQVVVQTPAGSSTPHVYDAQTNTFIPEKEAGFPRRINFLPLPGNGCFIPSTNTEPGNAEVAVPLEALLLAGSLDPGTVKEVIPVGTLVLEIDSELVYKILTVPARPIERVINVTDFDSFRLEYPAAKEIIQQWFLHAQPNQSVKFVGWKDERFTEKLIQKFLK